MKVDDTISAVLAHKGSEVWSIGPDATVYQAIERMAEKNIGALLVVEAERLIGIISERDYTRKVILKGKASKETRVREIMSTSVDKVGLQHTVEDCMRLMTEKRVRHLPVVEGEKLMGVVSIGNLVNWIIDSQSQTIDHLANYIAGKYPG